MTSSLKRQGRRHGFESGDRSTLPRLLYLPSSSCPSLSIPYHQFLSPPALPFPSHTISSCPINLTSPIATIFMQTPFLTSPFLFPKSFPDPFQNTVRICSEFFICILGPSYIRDYTGKILTETRQFAALAFSTPSGLLVLHVENSLRLQHQ